MAEDAVDQGTSGDGVDTHLPDETQPDETQPDDDSTTDEDDAYGGLLGAFPYAFRSSDSLLFKSYAVLGGLAALLTALLFGLALVVLLGNTVGADGGTFSFVRAFFIFVGLLVVAPLVAPVLFVARRIRRGGSDRRYDATLAALGYAFMASLYVGGIISTPAADQQSPGGALEPILAALYSLPRPAGLVPPLVVAAAIVVIARRWNGRTASEP